ncbi:MAG: hypothetical protein PHU91_01265 [Candidatus Omnitrophica bacterium]|nr:hypothetical protein [Candidatus Omnitrophota bacterium]
MLSGNIKRILVINLGGMGDLLLSRPALKALKNHFPQAEISLLVIPQVYEVAVSTPYVDKVYILYNDPRCLFRDAGILFSLRCRHFDLAINMRTLASAGGARKIKFILDFIKPRVSAGRDTDGRGQFFDMKVPETLKGKKYEMEYDIDTVTALGAAASDRNVEFKTDEESVKRI